MNPFGVGILFPSQFLQQANVDRIRPETVPVIVAPPNHDPVFVDQTPLGEVDLITLEPFCFVGMAPERRFVRNRRIARDG